ncbi:MAG: translocation/assembly module TamB domain-containing protein, partial [Deltaproteobacteria bacterium]|nr:translocation/assembly module TamB domain-containing protein [Deltaproteobacteria bacterium]
GRVDPRKGGGQADNTMAVTSAVSQALLGSMLSSIAPKIGIDVMRVDLGQSTNDQGETRFRAEAEVGKYLMERLYLGYRRVFGASNEENANEGLLEFRLSARWLLMAVFGDAGVGGIDALWTYRY